VHSKLLLVVAGLALSLSVCAQVQPAASGSGIRFGIGGGLDYWWGDYGNIRRFGPAVWVTADVWHGLGVLAEGHALDFGDGGLGSRYTYYEGVGGAVYNYHRWRTFTPFAKAELGFGGLSFPHSPTATYTHDTRTTWALGGGAEYKLWRRVWVRGDYTYDSFPDFLNHTLDPNGVTLGFTYHLR
jgi:opacity protein-like surface antigen